MLSKKTRQIVPNVIGDDEKGYLGLKLWCISTRKGQDSICVSVNYSEWLKGFCPVRLAG